MLSIFAVLLSVFAQPAKHPGDRFTHFAGFDLGQATLSAVQARYGKSRVRQSGDAGDYEAWICYSTPSGEVQFNSGEMGGGADVLGFTIDATHPAIDCPKSKRALPDDIGGLQLGISQARFIAMIEDPIKWTQHTGTSTFDYRSTADGKTSYVYITVTATFRSSRLVRLVVWRVETA